MTLTETQLESKLWGAADILRGQIDSADYKNYIFSMLFLKRLSDHFEEETEKAVEAGQPREVAEKDEDEHEFFLPDHCRWNELVKTSMGLGEALNKASIDIEMANPRLDGVLRFTNWNDDSKLGTPASRERIIRSLLTHFSDLNLRDDNLDGQDILGDAYEYLISKFADDAGKKGGEFYTPRSVVNLIVELVKPKEGMRICDPTAGSGGMLVYAARYVSDQGGNPTNLALHAQERNLGTMGICKLNVLLHNLTARVEAGDVIREPALIDDQGRLLSYDRVIANPPFSLKDWGYEAAALDRHHRFDRYGAIPPKTKGDLAFLQHMLAVTKPDGMVGVVMPHGILFRGGSEAVIRKGLVESDLFEAIIGLTPNLFDGASIPVAICILNKSKGPERKGKVLFMDAAQAGYYRAGKAESILDPEHIEKITAAFNAFKELPGVAHIADLSEIESNEFNLNISRYVQAVVTAEPIDIDEALRRLRQVELERDEAVKKMDALLAELGYAR